MSPKRPPAAHWVTDCWKKGPEKPEVFCCNRVCVGGYLQMDQVVDGQKRQEHRCEKA
jgi:hypothetical protein